jgi:uncharacterized phosphatase
VSESGQARPTSTETNQGNGGQGRPLPLATTVCLVRHGETDWNREGRLQGREDIALNARGREQAGLAAAFLAQRHWDLVVSSPLARAAETASIIARHLGLEHVVSMDEFVERDYGAAAGLTLAERKDRFPGDAWPGLEERSAVAARCLAGLRALVRTYPGHDIVVVSHGAAINAILAALSGGEIGTGKTTLGNACINELHFRADAWEIVSYNVVSHMCR